MNDLAKNLLLWIVIAIVLVSVFNNFGPRPSSTKPLEYSEFVASVKNGIVERVLIEGRSIHGITNTGERFTTYSPGDPGLIGDLLDNGVLIEAKPPEQQGILMQVFISWFPMLLLILLNMLNRLPYCGIDCFKNDSVICAGCKFLCGKQIGA